MILKNVVLSLLTMTAHATTELILIADPRVLAIPIQENNEPFIDLRDQTIIAFGDSPEIPNNTDYTKMRKTVYEKLVAAQNMLPKGLKFCLYEGYRSMNLQKQLFDARYNITQKDQPTWNHAELFLHTIRLVSPVINLDGSINIPPHCTGGAVDIYLVDEHNQPVDMGMHPADWIEDKDVATTHSRKISPQAQHYRAIMGEVLSKVGFINYPTEYWHWSYGDRYWAYHTNHTYALYGAMR